MKTYKFYLNASKYFLNLPTAKLDPEEIEYNNVAATLLAWMCFESYVNAMCDSLSMGTRIKDSEKLFLKEKDLTVDDDGKFKEISIRPSTLKKLLFLIEYFSQIHAKEFKQADRWKNLQAFEELRNKIVHHKEINNYSIDHNKASECRDLVEDTIKEFNRTFTRVRVK
ncbi:MAG: hypothetical protein ABSC20_11670 [Candidatus Bathyarchaeia archaeon]|jgi:hypothetical protein